MKTYRLILLCALMWAFAVPRVFAAAVVLEAMPGSSGADGSFAVNAYLDTEGESVNGIEGTILIPADVLRAREVRAGDSSVALWIEPPRPKVGAIPFTGVIPGGVSGPKLFLFSIVIGRQSARSALLTANLRKALRNDGTGNEVPVRKTSMSIAAMPVPARNPGSTLLQADILQAVGGGGTDDAPATGNEEDIFPPDVFQAAFGRDDGLFGGKYFMAFVTQDKGSGISHYEVSEEGYAPVRAVSPYLLKNQKIDKKVFVTAFDARGNARTVVAYPPGWQPWYRRYGMAFMGAGLLCLLLLARMRGYFSKKQSY